MQLVAPCYLTVTPGYLVVTFGYLTATNVYFCLLWVNLRYFWFLLLVIAARITFG